MPTISNAIQTLTPFSELEDVMTAIRLLNSLEGPGRIAVKDVVRLRQTLDRIVNTSRPIRKNGMSLPDIAYQALLAVAERRPINDIDDPITFLPIDESCRVVVSTGYQFDIHALIKYHKTRGPRAGSLGETVHNKWLLDPFTNEPFSSRDVAHIYNVALQKGIQLQMPKTEPKPVTSFHAIGLFSAASNPLSDIEINSDIQRLINQHIITASVYMSLSAEKRENITGLAQLIEAHHITVEEAIRFSTSEALLLHNPHITHLILERKITVYSARALDYADVIKLTLTRPLISRNRLTVYDALRLNEGQCLKLHLPGIQMLLMQGLVTIAETIQLNNHALSNLDQLHSIILTGHLSIRTAKSLGSDERDLLKKPYITTLILDGRLSIDVAKQLTPQQMRDVEAGLFDDNWNETLGAQRLGGDCRIM